MIRRFRHLPHSLQVLFATYGTGPLAFFAAWLINVPALVGLPVWYLALAGFVYAVGPWAVAWFLIQRQRAFLYAFAVWGLALIATAFVAPGGLPGAFIFVHATFAMTMVMTALVLVNRDLLLPLMFPERRGWRLAPRVQANLRARITIPRMGREVTVMMEDCSLTGIAAYGSEDAVADAFEKTIKGEPMLVSCTIARRTFEIGMFCMWQSHAAGVHRMGLKAQQPEQMIALFEALQPVQPGRNTARKLREKWGGPSVRRALNYVLAVALLSLMMLPPLFLDNGPAHRAFVAVKSWISPDAPSKPPLPQSITH